MTDILQTFILPYLIAAFIFLCGYSVGSRFYREPLLAVAVGMGIVSMGIFLIGLLQILYPWVVCVWLISVFLLGRPLNLINRLNLNKVKLPETVAGKARLGICSKPYWTPGGKYMDIKRPCILSICLVLILLMAIILNLHTPLFPVVGWDAGNSHMEAPKTFIADHGIRFYPYINFNNFPMFSEMLTLPCLMAGVPTAAQCVTFIWFLLTIALLITHFKNRIVGILACLILMTVPAYMRQVSGATVDVALVFYLTMTLLLIREFDCGQWKKLAVLIGVSISIKYTAIPVVILGFGWLLYQRYYRRVILNVALLALLIASPYYIRNIVLFGNPVFPFLHDWFSWIPGMVDATTRQMLAVDSSEMLAKFSYPGGIERMVTWIWTITMDTRWADRMILAGPVILLGLSLYIWSLKTSWATSWSNTRFYLLLTVGITGIYILGSGICHSRYFAPVYPLLAIMGAYGLNSILKNRMKASITILICVSVIGVFLVGNQLHQTQNRHLSDLPVTPAAQEQYKRTHLMGYSAIQWLNQRNRSLLITYAKTQSDDGRSSGGISVYGLNLEANRFHANFRLIGGIYGMGTHRDLLKIDSGEQLYQYLCGFGIDYLAVNKFRTAMVIQRYPEMNPTTKPGFFEYFYEIYDDPQVRIYKLKEDS